jgi:hypothetical protein
MPVWFAGANAANPFLTYPSVYRKNLKKLA